MSLILRIPLQIHPLIIPIQKNFPSFSWHISGTFHWFFSLPLENLFKGIVYQLLNLNQIRIVWRDHYMFIFPSSFFTIISVREALLLFIVLIWLFFFLTFSFVFLPSASHTLIFRFVLLPLAFALRSYRGWDDGSSSLEAGSIFRQNLPFSPLTMANLFNIQIFQHLGKINKERLGRSLNLNHIESETPILLQASST